MLRADLHVHTAEDPQDTIPYSAKELIDFYATLAFDVIAITNHGTVTYSESLRKYAQKKGILLIPGAEVRTQGKEVLVYNVTDEDIRKVRTFSDIARLKKKKDVMVIAPHPFFVLPQCLGKKLITHIALFDAIEHSFFYFKHLNLNRKAKRIAERYGKAVVANSDAHTLTYMENNYSMIDAEKNIGSVFDAIRKGKVRIVTRPLSLVDFMRVSARVVIEKSKTIMTYSHSLKAGVSMRLHDVQLVS